MSDANIKNSNTPRTASKWEDALLRLGVYDRKARSKMTLPEHKWRIIRYQRVIAPEQFPYPPSGGSFVSIKAFVQHIHYLKYKCNVVPLSQLIETINSHQEVDPFTVALTFDGGYIEHTTEVAPLLNHLQLPATFFLMPKYLDTNLPRWPEAIMAFATLCKLNDTPLTTFAEFEMALKQSGEIARFSNWNHFDQAENIINHIQDLPLERRETVIEALMRPVIQGLTGLQQNGLDSRIAPTFSTKAEFRKLNPALFSLAIMGMTGEPMTSLSPQDQVSEVLSAQDKLRAADISIHPYFAFPNGLVDPEMLASLTSLGISTGFGINTLSRKPLTRRSSVPLFPRLAIYENIAPHQVAFVKTLWGLNDD